MKRRKWHNYFYIGSLNHKATSSLPGQPNPGFHYIQKFYKSHTKITLLNKEIDKIFDSQKSNLRPYKNHTHFNTFLCNMILHTCYKYLLEQVLCVKFIV